MCDKKREEKGVEVCRCKRDERGLAVCLKEERKCVAVKETRECWQCVKKEKGIV